MGDLYDETEEDIGTVPTCETCGAERVVRGAWLCWNRSSGLWELETSFEEAHCLACAGPTQLAWQPSDGRKPVKRITELNDAFRSELRGQGTVVITPGIEELGPEAVADIFRTVQEFKEFSPESDPWGEHDFGAFDYGDERVFWKIDCYDRTRTTGSPNPANAGVTHRVLTIMLAFEY